MTHAIEVTMDERQTREAVVFDSSQAAGADMNGQLVIAWMFADSLEFTAYELLATQIEDLQAAQQVAQRNAHAGVREKGRRARNRRPSHRGVRARRGRG
jgi:hypothetical protein